MPLLIITGDLVLPSRLQLAARGAGTECMTALSAAKGIELVGGQSCQTVCVDLSAPGVKIATLVTELRAAAGERPLRIIAFASHVHTELLAAAVAAGCDRVCSRGEFDRAIPTLVQEV